MRFEIPQISRPPAGTARVARPALLAAACGLGLWITPAEAEPRTWKDAQGRTITAEFAGMQGDSVLLKLSPEKTVPYPMARLSAEDQEYVKKAAGAGGEPSPAAPAPGAGEAAAPAADPQRVPLEKRVWPQNIEVPSRSIEIAVVGENEAKREYVYRSEAFEFTSQAKLAGSVMKEVARTFEATRSLVNALPWGIVCRPPEGRERFLAALFETREDYITNGGPANSGGVYSTGDKVFKIPFPSLGLEKRGQTYFKSDFSSDTLVHEITHQMMDEYLTFMPVWVVEGTAEYTEMLPYKAGTFRADAHKSGLKETTSSWRPVKGMALELGSLETHMTMNRETWQQACAEPEMMREMYRRSLILVYFFCHLDGDQKGTRFIRYMDAVHQQVQARRQFFADPRVKNLGNGRFSYPSSLKPPDMDSKTAPFVQLPILLNERPYPRIAAELVEAYKNIGVKIGAR